MPLKEKIYHAVTIMNNDELRLLYEQIQLFQHMKQRSSVRKPYLALEDILRMTSSDSGCWSETVKDDRRERL